MMDIIPLLDYINPDDYKIWLDVGMALKNEGYSCNDWDVWSKKSSKYKSGECAKKWRSFAVHGDLTAGTVVHYAEQGGYTHQKAGYTMLDYNDFIQRDGDDSGEEWSPVRELRKYVTTLFESNDKINYVTAALLRDGRYNPANKGVTKKVADILKELDKHDNITDIIGDYNHAAGVWVRFNPLDGNGVGNDNVTAYRYALVESDTMSLEAQRNIYKKLELPVAVLVYSGGKSLHAIVRINAGTKEEYTERVQYLYTVCEKNGLTIDKNNKNPARLSRLPGVERGDKRQYIVDTNCGKPDFETWKRFIENNELPEITDISDMLIEPPKLSPPIIDGVLRAGHKMVITAPSKAGKSYLLIELCAAFATGSKWMGYSCTQGKVLYINLEIDSASFVRRCADVCDAMGVHIPRGTVDIWDLRGYAAPLDTLVPQILDRAKDKGYIAIIIDPIYKRLMGDENSASDMGKFCNQFDKLCTHLGCAVIYAHHHRKGDLSATNSIDRGSGSGVISRDADAIIDLSPLKIPEHKYNDYIDITLQQICGKYGEFEDYNFLYDGIKPDSMTDDSFMVMMHEVTSKREELKARTAFRMEMTLREFKPQEPKNIWFSYPLHFEDGTIAELLKKESKRSNIEEINEKKQQQKDDAVSELSCRLNELKDEGVKTISISELVKITSEPESTLRGHLKKLKITVSNGKVWL